MTTSDYLFIYFSLLPDSFIREPWESKEPGVIATDDEIVIRKRAFRVFRSVSMYMVLHKRRRKMAILSMKHATVYHNEAKTYIYISSQTSLVELFLKLKMV
eukprot:GHVO01051240.1.p1 GENE.GHVO01051240.1~~GHVO01051240.1.p1  ORF type:complete len:101 (-),score=10.05 GHVO01051240.1:196-498(-)